MSIAITHTKATRTKNLLYKSNGRGLYRMKIGVSNDEGMMGGQTDVPLGGKREMKISATVHGPYITPPTRATPYVISLHIHPLSGSSPSNFRPHSRKSGVISAILHTCGMISTLSYLCALTIPTSGRGIESLDDCKRQLCPYPPSRLGLTKPNQSRSHLPHPPLDPGSNGDQASITLD